ncbi:hypothetical protein E2C01_035324 [Portunus trituberculatus]|uniref:Uncharacterized protein n=1 Tax=Portunus trituberculatus TaxID=210409 RepID=A0A5B7F9G4_PORTR|nr:hypothetical protein [Portunus trituberculatus]
MIATKHINTINVMAAGGKRSSYKLEVLHHSMTQHTQYMARSQEGVRHLALYIITVIAHISGSPLSGIRYYPEVPQVYSNLLHERSLDPTRRQHLLPCSPALSRQQLE